MSGILYPILILTLFLIVQILTMMASRKAVLDKNKKQLLDSVNASNKIYTNEELSILLAEQQKKNEELSAVVDNLVSTSYNKTEVDQLIESKKTTEYTQVIDLRSGYDENIWYPVATEFSYYYPGYRRFRCIAILGESGKPSWSRHASGFTTSTDVMGQLGGWGAQPAAAIVFANDFRYTDNLNPVGYRNYSEISRSIFYLRGGGRYVLHSDYPATWQIYTSKYVFNGTYNLYLEPLSSNPGLIASDGVTKIR